MHPKRSAIQPIAFLSRTLTKREKSYWVTELEMAGVIWAVRKSEKWLNQTTLPAILFADHSAIVNMVKQSDIVNTTALSVSNNKLLRALEYLSYFDIRFVHRPGHEHLIPDALGRLPTDEAPPPDDQQDELETILLTTAIDPDAIPVKFSAIAPEHPSLPRSS